MDAGGVEMMAIIEKDDIQEEASIDMIELTTKRGKWGAQGGSPGRLMKAVG